MADVFEYSPLRAQQAQQQYMPLEGQFSKGARAAWLGMGSSLQNLAGGVAEALGANDFAAQRYKDAAELEQRAAQTGPRMSSLSQLRDGGYTWDDIRDYVAGVLGGAAVSTAPALAAGALTPVAWGVRGALATGALAYTPLETGEVVGRMREESGGQPIDGAQLARAGATGLGSAVLQAVPGVIVGGKIANKPIANLVGGQPGRQTLKSAVVRNLWEAPAEGVSEGAGEAVKQVGAGQQLDLGRIGESAVAGTIGGAGYSTVGAAADYVRGNIGAARETITRGADAARGFFQRPRMGGPDGGVGGQSAGGTEPMASGWDKFSTVAKSAWEGVRESDLGKTIAERAANTRNRLTDILNDPETPDYVKTKASELMNNIGERSTQLWAAGVDKFRNVQRQIKEEGLREAARSEWRKAVDAMAQGLDVVDQKLMANATTAQATELLKQGAEKATTYARGMGEELLRRMDVSPETKARVQEAMANLGDKANQTFLAAKWRAIDAKDALVNKTKNFIKRWEESRGKSFSARRSDEDYEHIRALVAEGLRPHAARINEELGNDPEALNTLGDALRTYLEAATTTTPDEKTALDLNWARLQIAGLLNGDSANVVADLVGKLNLTGNRAQAEAVFREANELAQADTLYRNLQDLLTRYAPPDTTTSQIREVQDRLIDWASGALTRGKGAEESRFIDTQVRNAVEQQFGKTGAKAIFRRLERLTSKTDNGVRDTAGEGIDKAQWSDDLDYSEKPQQNIKEPETTFVGGGKRGSILVKRPGLDTEDSTAAQLIQRLKAEHPDAQIEFVPLAEDPSLFDKAEPEQRKLARYREQLERDIPGEANAQAREKAYAEFRDKMLRDLQERGLGMIRISKLPSEGKFSDDDIRRMKFDEGRGGTDHPSRLVVRDAEKPGDRIVLDAVKVTRRMMGRINTERTWTESDDMNSLTRMGRAFADAVTALMDKYGKFKVSPDLVIGHVNGQPVTAAQALKYDKRTQEDRARDAARDKLEKLRKEYRAAQKAGDEQLMAELRLEADKIVGEFTAKKNRELGADYDRDVTGDKTQTYTNEDGERVTQVERNLSGRASIDDILQEQGRYDTSLNDNIHLWLAKNGSREDLEAIFANGDPRRGGSKKTAQELMTDRRDTAPRKSQINVDPTGAVLEDNRLDVPRWFDKQKIKALVLKGEKLKESNNAVTAKIGSRLATLAQNAPMMSEADYRKLVGLITLPPSEMSPVVNELARKYADRIMPPQGKDDVSKGRQADSARTSANTDVQTKVRSDGGAPDPKVVAAKRAAFLKRAASGDQALIDELKTSDDVKGLQRALRALNEANVAPEVAQVIHDRLAELIKDPQNAYDAQTLRYSHEPIDATSNEGISPQKRKEILDYIHKVLGDYVQVEFANLGYSGEFTERELGDIIRISIHALNPQSVAYHESLHAFFKLLREKNLHEVTDPIFKAVSTPFVMNQLRQRLEGKGGAALAQLRDPEERAAYAYQYLMSDPTFKLRPETQTVFQRIADFFKRLLGVVSNDAQALKIFEYFSSGQFKQRMEKGETRLIYKELVEANRSQILETVKSFTKPLIKLADAVVGAGAQRLRDTNIPALVQLANMTKPELGQDYKDPGFIAAARLARSRFLSKMMDIIHDSGASRDVIDQAHQMLISDQDAPTPEARLLARQMRKFLREMYDTYLKPNIPDLGDRGENYFPRVWDSYYISQHLDAFKLLLGKYGYSPEIAEAIAADAKGEYLHEVNRPGMESALARTLDKIPPEEAAEFVVQDFFQVMDLYVTQGTRRVEWAKRFGNNNEKLDALLKRAVEEGATPEQIAMAERYMRGVNGTLGDDIDPTARRWMGNMIVYQNLRLLPLAIFSSVVDPMGVMVRGGTLRDAWETFKRGFKELPKSWKKDPTFDAETELAETLGVIDNVMLSDFMSQQFTQGMVGGTAKRINDALFRYNFMEGWNRSVRVGATQAAMRFIMRHATKPNEHSERYLAELGLRPEDVKIVDGRLAVLPSDGLTKQQANRMRIAINKWVDGAVLRPDAADRPIWMNDPHWALIAHFKNFVFAFHHTILKRVWHEIKHGNYAPAMALAGYVPVMMVADFAKDMLTNGFDEPDWKKNWTLMDHVEYGVERAGLFGVGQFALDMYQDVKLGGMGIGALGGPTIDQLSDAIQVVGGVRQFEPFALRSLPANALYRSYVSGE